MTPLEVLLPLGGVMTLSYLVQTVSGFGAMIVAITAGAFFVPIETLVAIAVPLSLVQNTWIAVRHHDGIQRRLLFVTILPVMGVGMGVGFFVAERLAGDALRMAFGTLVLVLAIRELVLSFGRSADKPKPLGRVATSVTVFSAGILHGIYATGGPLLVYAVGRLELGKHAFRSTLTSVWLLLNLVLSGMMIANGRITAETGMASAMLIPAIPIGLLLGEWVHHRVNEEVFRRLLFSLLAIAALPLILR